MAGWALSGGRSFGLDAINAVICREEINRRWRIKGQVKSHRQGFDDGPHQSRANAEEPR